LFYLSIHSLLAPDSSLKLFSNFRRSPEDWSPYDPISWGLRPPAGYDPSGIRSRGTRLHAVSDLWDQIQRSWYLATSDTAGSGNLQPSCEVRRANFSRVSDPDESDWLESQTSINLILRYETTCMGSDYQASDNLRSQIPHGWNPADGFKTLRNLNKKFWEFANVFKRDDQSKSRMFKQSSLKPAWFMLKGIVSQHCHGLQMIWFGEA
jgi:hypothetical protein